MLLLAYGPGSAIPRAYVLTLVVLVLLRWQLVVVDKKSETRAQSTLHLIPATLDWIKSIIPAESLSDRFCHSIYNDNWALRPVLYQIIS